MPAHNINQFNRGVMNRAITLVEIIDGEELLTNKSKAFTDPRKAEKYFINILQEEFGPYPESFIESCIDDGYYADETHFSIELKEITLED